MRDIRAWSKVQVQLLLIVLGVGNAVVGFWAALAPRSFYDSFPGGGRHWVGVDGPFNEHLIRDVGSLNLALVVVVLAALLRPTRFLVQVAASAELVYSLPHFLYHVTHLDPFGRGDKVALLGSLAVTVIAPIALLVLPNRSGLTSSRPSDQAITKMV